MSVHKQTKDQTESGAAHPSDGSVLVVRQSQVDAAQLQIELLEYFGEPITAGLRALAAVRPGAPVVVDAY